MAEELGERVLVTPQNPISIAMTVDSLTQRLQRRRQAAVDAAEPPASTAAGAVPAPALGAARPADPGAGPLCDVPPACGGSSAGKAAKSTCAAGSAATAGDVADQGGVAAVGEPVAECEVTEQGGGRRGGSGVRGDTATVLGALLWQRHVSGVRVICMGKQQRVGGILFDGYGSSCDTYGHDYMTAAAALGGTREDVDRLVAKLRKCWAAV